MRDVSGDIAGSLAATHSIAFCRNGAPRQLISAVRCLSVSVALAFTETFRFCREVKGIKWNGILFFLLSIIAFVYRGDFCCFSFVDIERFGASIDCSSKNKKVNVFMLYQTQEYIKKKQNNKNSLN